VAGIATVAGADPPVAFRLGVAMTALQASIGSLNDVVDAPRDAGHKPGKPIPSGLVSATAARVVAVVAAAAGLGLSVPSGVPTVALGVVVLAIGYTYDLVFKGTAWSWVPFAVGIPLLPVFAWLGSVGTVPASFAILIPVAVVAGAALAIANARADLERDAAAGVDSVAVRLGLDRSWAMATGLLAGVVAAALVTLVRGEASAGTIAVAAGAGVLIAVGSGLGRRGDGARRERAWQLQAIGVALLAAAWLAGIELASRPAGMLGG
jgi:4-hydroxybenzoate polyprenyltransferase